MCTTKLHNADAPKRDNERPSPRAAAMNRPARRFPRGSAVLAITLMLAGGLRCLFAIAQTVQEGAVINREYTIKAAFLYHFLTYVEWPAETFTDQSQPFVIGVFDTDPFGEVLDKIAETKTVGGRPIEVRRLKSMSDLPDCHILFVPRSVPTATQDAVLATIRGSHVFSVGESSDFVDRGGAAQFFLEGNKVRFTFNTDVVEHTSLKISSKLLSLAKTMPDASR